MSLNALMAKALREDPKSYAEAVSGPDGSDWLVSMKLEHDSLMENKCWELVPRPAKSNVVRSKWVFNDDAGSLVDVGRDLDSGALPR